PAARRDPLQRIPVVGRLRGRLAARAARARDSGRETRARVADPPGEIMSIEVRDLWKRFGDFTALRDVSLRVEPGELLALLGPSGSGKTTLWRLIAGLGRPDTGSISFEGGDATHRSVRDRRVGFVFQHYALFRHMTVFENV